MTAGAGTARQEGRLVADRGPAGACAAAAACRALGGDGGRENEGGRVVAGETWKVSNNDGRGVRGVGLGLPSFEKPVPLWVVVGG